VIRFLSFTPGVAPSPSCVADLKTFIFLTSDLLSETGITVDEHADFFEPGWWWVSVAYGRQDHHERERHDSGGNYRAGELPRLG
jgi:hypothetical protein